MAKDLNRYVKLIENIFLEKFREGDKEIIFSRDEIAVKADQLGIVLPKNIGDVVYSFRYRNELPLKIIEKASKGYAWIIRGVGKGRYKFVLVRDASFLPNPNLAKIKIPDATPGIITKYTLDDEQALLAKIRYNRLIDIFTGVTCYSLQNHLRTTVSEIGQVETDEIYVGLDKNGIHYVFPVQAKGGKDKVGAVQIEQDFAICSEKFPDAVGRPIAAQFLSDDTIVLFEFVQTDEGTKVLSEKQYRLVQPDEISDDEIKDYRNRSSK